MKINLKKTLSITTILSASIATIGISCFIVGGYGNNINTLPEIQNSGFFGINTAFEKEKTTDYDTKKMYVDHLKKNLKIESDKIGGIEYNALNALIQKEEAELIIEQDKLIALKEAVDKAQIEFDKNRTDANKNLLNTAKTKLEDGKNSPEILTLKQSIKDNNQKITKMNQSKDDISRLDNYQMWDSLFITGASFFAIGTITVIMATSYSLYLKKESNKKENK